jgi:cysteine desulfurase/selenocysteine lyase
MIYLDNAATSWPKPPGVLRAISEVIEQAGGNPGRSGHRLSIQAARVVYNCRETLADFFHLSDPRRLIFTPNATYALNLVLKGYLKAGDSVIATAMEHNAVIRPLHDLENRGIKLIIAPCAADGSLDEQALVRLIEPSTRLLVITHASNVSGTLLPIERVISRAHQSGLRVLVDAAQTAGLIDINMERSDIDFLAFSGHKDLMGPTGIGGLLIHPAVAAEELEPLVRGGTGSRSESEYQPADLPDKYESGTANLVGIAGLAAGLQFIRETGIEVIREKSLRFKTRLLEGLSDIPGVRIYGPGEPRLTTGILAFTISGKKVSEIGFRLDEEYGILTRVGLHCAPAAHRTLGSFPEGSVRLSPGYFITLNEIEETLAAIQEVART